jgi:16S rRNA (cytidine1402-2'-O)-methyltransferase
MMSVLYIVATPIGNLEDISLRAIRVLREVNLIAAEDTRKTRRLLARYDIGTPMTSYYEHSKRSKLEYILERLKQEDIALVSEAGMPGLSDPGYELVTAASERGIRVVPIPGASAVITALVVSGLPTDRFSYLGFLPHKTAARKRLLESAAGEPGSIVVLETPHRLRAALEDIRLVLGDRRIAVCRELTKRFEEVYRGTVSQASEHFRTPRGEFTLVIEGKRAPKQPPMTAEIEEQLHYQYLSGATAKEAIARIAGETGLPRKELYRTWLKLGRVWEINKDSYHSLERRE